MLDGVTSVEVPVEAQEKNAEVQHVEEGHHESAWNVVACDESWLGVNAPFEEGEEHGESHPRVFA